MPEVDQIWRRRDLREGKGMIITLGHALLAIVLAANAVVAVVAIARIPEP